MDKRLVKLLQSGKIGGGNLYFLDTYNQAVHEDVACTIMTNINTANHHFIFERMSDGVTEYTNNQNGLYQVKETENIS
jgi:hypothetical protein